MDYYGKVHVHEGGLVTVGAQVPESVVSFTQLFTLMLPVGKFSVEGDPKVVDLVFPIIVCVKDLTWRGDGCGSDNAV
jgi:hypothetical protein